MDTWTRSSAQPWCTRWSRGVQDKTEWDERKVKITKGMQTDHSNSLIYILEVKRDSWHRFFFLPFSLLICLPPPTVVSSINISTGLVPDQCCCLLQWMMSSCPATESSPVSTLWEQERTSLWRGEDMRRLFVLPVSRAVYLIIKLKNPCWTLAVIFMIFTIGVNELWNSTS